jgi:hypothetical protein
MVEAPILAHPDFDKPFILYSDASYFGFGYILSQEKDGIEYPVRYGSRKISPAENNYTITELECSAVVWSVRENKQFLGINPFTLVTDHKALATIQTQELPQERRRIRWILELNQYNYIIKYHQGKKMAHVDFFSRNPVSYTAQNQQDEQYFQPIITVVEGPQTPWHIQPLTNQVWWAPEVIQEEGEPINLVSEPWWEIPKIVQEDDRHYHSLQIVDEPTPNSLAATFSVGHISKYMIVFIYTEEGPYFSQRIHPDKPMYLKYQTPCGKVDQGENSRQAANRELYEETNLSIK